MATKTASSSEVTPDARDVGRLVKLMTAAAWFFLGLGIALSLYSIEHFSEENTALMVGLGFMVGSVFIYVIRTAIHLVHSRAESENE
ncbi:hypothetical protein [Paenibacillus sp. y28]|uniref:hypothetical protein n=1 Tax=Paenibacillus sp. y28 TaxID=3129110 RepID=UPI0030158A7F